MLLKCSLYTLHLTYFPQSYFFPLCHTTAYLPYPAWNQCKSLTGVLVTTSKISSFHKLILVGNTFLVLIFYLVYTLHLLWNLQIHHGKEHKQKSVSVIDPDLQIYLMGFVRREITNRLLLYNFVQFYQFISIEVLSPQKYYKTHFQHCIHNLP